MKIRLLTLVCLFTAKSAFAISIPDMPGYGNDIAVLADTAVLAGDYSFSPASGSAIQSLTDDFAQSWAYSNSTTAYMDLTFGTEIVDASGTDLSIFFVGAHAHSIALQLFSGATSTKAKTFSDISYTGYCVDNDFDGSCSGMDDDPIYVMDIDFSIFFLFDPIDSIRIDVSKGSAVPSLIGAHHTAVIPLPLPLLLFMSGLTLMGAVASRKTRNPGQAEQLHP